MLDKQSNAYLILPDKIRAESSLLLLSSWLNDGMFRPDMEVRNAVSRIDRVLAAIPEVAVVLRLMLDMKKRWLVIVFRGFKNHQIVGKLDSNRSMRPIKTVKCQNCYIKANYSSFLINEIPL
jgi:hypothetical protein